MSAIANSIEIDLTEVETEVGATSFKRGVAYARANRVRSTDWDEDALLLRGRIVGNGGLYNTTAHFLSDGEGLEFDYGECSCPIGWNCKHVAALTVVVAGDAGARRAGKTAVRTATATTVVPLRPRRAAQRAAWEEPLRAMIEGPVQRATGTPLAIELSIAFNSSGGTVGAPRLQARLMRPGARGGWVNGSLRWGSLDPWDLRDASYREDQVALAREFQAVHQARLATAARYHYYGYGDRDKTLDVSDWDAGQLWPLLDAAARIGLLTIHASGGLGEVPRYRRGELVLDVAQAAAGSARISPTLQLDGSGGAPGFEPLLFLGNDGHGLLLVETGGTGQEPRRSSSSPGPAGPLRLVRLARETPPALQRLVLDGHHLTVPAGELPRFATEMAPALRRVAPIVSSDASFTAPEVSPPELVLRARHDDGHITRVEWGWQYTIGDRRVAFELQTNGQGPGLRDLDAERAVLDGLDLGYVGLRELGLVDADGRPRNGATVIDGFETVAFVTDALPALAAAADVGVELTGEPLDYRDVDGAVEIGISTREIRNERDWFDLDLTIRVEGRELPLAEVFAALARGETRMLLDDGAHFSLLTPELESLRQLIEEARALGDGGRAGSLRISRYQAGLWQELVGLGVVREQADGWQRQVEALLHLDALADHALPDSLAAELRPYQLDGFRWLASLWELGLGGILADDMGLGKTVQTLALICHARAAGEHRPFLVVAPTSVVSNWVAEADRFAPGLAVQALTDTLARASMAIDEALDGADVIVTTYTLARLDEDHYHGVQWAGVILDEAQAVKNHNAKTHAAVRRMPAPFKLAITGTPMENNLRELWALLSITAPGLFPDPKAFDDHYARPIERDGDGDRLARLRRRIRPLVKRRTKEHVAADLPAKQEQLLEVTLHPRHRKLYNTHLARERQRLLGLLDDFDANRFSILTGITRLRQLSLHAGLVDGEAVNVPCAKLEALTEQLQDVIGGGHRALVFSQFTGFLGLVRERLEAADIGCCYLDGRTRRRERVLAQFKDGTDPVFLISLKAGGIGLNLTEADYCFLLDPWWNPATEAQAIDRAHRIGQRRQVMVYRLVARDTIEEKVVALAQRKAALFSGVMDDGDLFAGEITAADIRGLLS